MARYAIAINLNKDMSKGFLSTVTAVNLWANHQDQLKYFPSTVTAENLGNGFPCTVTTRSKGSVVGDSEDQFIWKLP